MTNFGLRDRSLFPSNGRDCNDDQSFHLHARELKIEKALARRTKAEYIQMDQIIYKHDLDHLKIVGHGVYMHCIYKKSNMLIS
jgi:hypothetical protein